MAFKISRPGMALALCLSGAAAMAACGGGGATGSSTTHGSGASTSTSTTTSASSGGMGGATASSSGGGGIQITTTGTGGSMQGFDVEPTPPQTVNVTVGMPPMTVTYNATLNGMAAAGTGWGLDQGNLGSLSAAAGSSVVFTPSGKAGGLVNITAALNNMTAKRQVMIKLSATQNGADPNNPAEQPQIPSGVGSLTAGGGVGGVGGEGLGPGVTDPPTLTALGAPSDGKTVGLAFLYPYDKTVWPRGLLAPLLQWSWTPPGGAAPGDADAIQISLKTTSGSFSYTGTFARPAILGTTKGPFIRHPIPQDIWDMATNSASGTADQLTVSLVVAKGGKAYGPISETWTIAPARLAGTIYYQSYGTQLAHNLCCNYGSTTSLFGGAILSIRVGDTAPKLVAGSDGSSAQCRVCHSVAAFGSRLIAQWGSNGDATTSAYDLSPSAPPVEHQLMHNATFAGVYPDGSMVLTEGGLLLPLPTDTTPLASTGLSTVTTSLGPATFSPDGKSVAFNPMAASAMVTSPQQMLMVMSFDKATNTFSNPVTIVDDKNQPADTRPGWPAFFPDGKSIVFEHQSAAGYDGNGPDLHTRKGATGQIAWTSTTDATHVTPLDNLNGKGYLPKLPAANMLQCTGDGVWVGGGTAPAGTATIPNPDLDHSADVDHNYEPTVNPIPSGGYAWVVFTSRRMYGTVASIPPFCSDPRGVDLVSGANITPKKLWVAAIDLSGTPGTDASHPAFYLPAQELLAGNARGFWVLDPCQADGASCMTGDQCCNGYCEPNGTGGALICSSTPPAGSCSGLQEKCTTAADCCDTSNICLNGFCAQKQPG